MDDQDKFPRLSSDLVDWLDEFVETPTFPLTPTGCRAFNEELVRLGSFQAGARNLVNQLIAWRAELEDNNAEDDSDDSQARLPFPRVLGDGTSVDEDLLGVRMVEGDD